MNILNFGSAPTVINTAINNFFVPCVPISVSENLVAIEPLVKKLSAAVSSSSPELVNLSLVEFANIQLKKSELRLKIDECATMDETLLDACLLNIEDFFSELAAYQTMMEPGKQTDACGALKRLHAYAAAIGLAVDTYCVKGVIHPDKLFDACLNRLQALQKNWHDNYFQSIELALQLQRDAVYGAAASCLMEICQDGLDNQISLEPTPQAQEDVLVSLATFVDAPFSGEWPVLRERVIVLGCKNAEGGVQ
jgi:hypothetical protein